jgi:acyl-CoA thioester hydrolase
MNTIDEVTILPKTYDTEITDDYLDEYGHMNVRWYAELWGNGAGGFMTSLGMNFREAVKDDRGYWVLRQIIDYNAEVLSGDTIAIHGRMLGYSDKCMHNMYWMVNETQGKIASTSEVLVGYADLAARRLTPFPQERRDFFDTKIAEWDAHGWLAQTSGAISLSPTKS